MELFHPTEKTGFWATLKKLVRHFLGGGFEYFWNFHPDPWGFMIQFDEHTFSNGLVQPPTSFLLGHHFVNFFVAQRWSSQMGSCWRTDSPEILQFLAAGHEETCRKPVKPIPDWLCQDSGLDLCVL